MIIGSYLQFCFLLILSTFLEKGFVLRLKKILKKFASLTQISKKIIFLKEKMMLKLGIYDMKLVNVCFFFQLYYLLLITYLFLQKLLTAYTIIASFIIFFVKIMLKMPQNCNPYPLTLGPILAERCHIFKFCKKGLKADEIYYTLRHKEIF